MVALSEIGSEFHSIQNENSNGLNLPSDVFDSALVFSGRTAIETVLRNLPKAKKAVLPSYCCNSMIEPFLQAGITVSFFDVNYYADELQINSSIADDTDIVLWCNYFGYSVSLPDLSEFINHGGVLIEDITHSLYSSAPYHAQSNFLVASLRKWEPLLCGGYCASFGSTLNEKPSKFPGEEFLRNKRSAMDLKMEYLGDFDYSKKRSFLSMFSESNRWLASNYSGLCIDSDSESYIRSINFESHKKARIQNAKVLYNGLKQCRRLKPLFEFEKMECPLVVPIIIEDGLRDLVIKRLIDHGIYCPVHWPHPDADCESNLFDLELSLICDQRYSINDMQRIISVLCD